MDANERKWMEQHVAGQREMVRKHLRDAVATMRRFCDDAERRLADDRFGKDAFGREPLTAVASGVMHDLAWGMANASGDVENALRDATEVAVNEATLAATTPTEQG